MSGAPAKMTSPGASENLAKQQSLAEAIASNLGAGRQEAESAPSPEQPERTPEPAPRAPEPVAEPEPRPEPLAAETQQAEGEPKPDTSETPETPDRYTLDDFAAAAELDADALLDRFELEVPDKDGTRRATLKDVLNGYRWDAANTQRAQEIAEQRKRIDAERAEVEQAHQKVNAMLGAQFQDVEAEETALKQQYDTVDWDGLRAKGSGAYADAQAQFRAASDLIETRKRRIADSWTQAQKHASDLAERQQAEAAPKARAKLLELVPEWGEDGRYQSEIPEITRWVQDTYGFSPDEQSKITDPRTIAAMRRLWVLESQARAGGTIAEKKLKTAVPKVLKPGQQRASQDGRQAARQKLAGRLRRSGRSQDLAALILHDRRT